MPVCCRLHTLDLRAHSGDLQSLVASCPALRHLRVSHALLVSAAPASFLSSPLALPCITSVPHTPSWMLGPFAHLIKNLTVHDVSALQQLMLSLQAEMYISR